MCRWRALSRMFRRQQTQASSHCTHWQKLQLRQVAGKKLTGILWNYTKKAENWDFINSNVRFFRRSHLEIKSYFSFHCQAFTVIAIILLPDTINFTLFYFLFIQSAPLSTYWPLQVDLRRFCGKFERRSRESNGEETIKKPLRRTFSRLSRRHFHRAPTKPPATQVIDGPQNLTT